MGTLVPQVALGAILAQPTQTRQSVQLFDGSRIFVKGPQYHWHAVVDKSVQAVDQEVRECIVSIADLLDRFAHRIKM